MLSSAADAAEVIIQRQTGGRRKHGTPPIAIFFDAVGTLIHPHPSAAIVYAEVAGRHGSRYTAAEIASRFRRAFQLEEELDRLAGWRTSEERELRRWRTIVGDVLDDVTDAEACFQELYRHFSKSEAWRLEADARPLLEALTTKGYVLGVASNYDQRLRTVWEGLPGLHACRCLVISSETGWRKPARQFFTALVRQANVPADRILYVGDDPVNDYAGARDAGLRAILLDPAGKPTSFSGERIARLSELWERLYEPEA
jgi:putative hydrolase of the HAD superfamily